MHDYWITSHWPTPHSKPGQSRHVFVKQHNRTLPKPGDVVFIRESIDAKDKHGRRVKKCDMHHRGQVTKGLDVRKGTGGIIGTATVCGVRRKQEPDDVVFDFGDLREWYVVPCQNFEEASLSLKELKDVLGKNAVRSLNLWPMRNDKLGSKLMHALRK